MVVFSPDQCFTRAVFCAVTINHIAKLINKKFDNFEFKCGIGIDYGKLNVRLQELTGEQEPDGMLYYLATPPSLYGVIPLHLKAAHLNRPHTRIIVEKPFGYDLESARELNRIYASVFEEQQIYRIDSCFPLC